ncbi:serine/threonine protein kinase [Acidovorax cavernicola]|nr:serine/threonine protein kinase [Acidovorax cavernicola]
MMTTLQRLTIPAALLAALLGAGVAQAQKPAPAAPMAGDSSMPASREAVKAEARAQNRNNANSVVPKGEASTTVNHQPNAMPAPTGERSRAEVRAETHHVKPRFGQPGERPAVPTNPTEKTGTPQ